jgi:hypothetical protein
VVGEPEEILDAEHEQVVERVCAIDVAKDSGKVCTRLPCESAPSPRPPDRPTHNRIQACRTRQCRLPKNRRGGLIFRAGGLAARIIRPALAPHPSQPNSTVHKT